MRILSPAANRLTIESLATVSSRWDAYTSLELYARLIFDRNLDCVSSFEVLMNSLNVAHFNVKWNARYFATEFYLSFDLWYILFELCIIYCLSMNFLLIFSLLLHIRSFFLISHMKRERESRASAHYYGLI